MPIPVVRDDQQATELHENPLIGANDLSALMRRKATKESISFTHR
jgi:hypothetical protein